MTVDGLAIAASSWGVLMGIAPVLQTRRMLSEQSSRDVSLGYFMVHGPRTASGQLARVARLAREVSSR